jgi:hypothetical protein
MQTMLRDSPLAGTLSELSRTREPNSVVGHFEFLLETRMKVGLCSEKAFALAYLAGLLLALKALLIRNRPPP